MSHASLKKNILNEKEIHATITEALHIQGLSPDEQAGILATIGQTMLIQVNTALLRALGTNGIAMLEEIPEEDDAAYAAKFRELLPNFQEIVRDAVAKSLEEHRIAMDKAFNGLASSTT